MKRQQIPTGRPLPLSASSVRPPTSCRSSEQSRPTAMSMTPCLVEAARSRKRSPGVWLRLLRRRIPSPGAAADVERRDEQARAVQEEVDRGDAAPAQNEAAFRAARAASAAGSLDAAEWAWDDQRCGSSPTDARAAASLGCSVVRCPALVRHGATSPVSARKHPRCSNGAGRLATSRGRPRGAWVGGCGGKDGWQAVGPAFAPGHSGPAKAPTSEMAGVGHAPQRRR